jgi:hypothetical protein
LDALAIAVGILILLIAAWLVFTRLSAKFSDRYESFCPSLAEADKDGAITRGLDTRRHSAEQFPQYP